MPARDEETPSTLERSPAKVRRTYEEALDAAYEQYEGDEERAHRTAWAAVKQVAEKKGDHWELKDEPGPSDERGDTHGGVDTKKSKQELFEDAQEAGIPGRSDMTKEQLVEALERHSRRETARARGD